MVGVINDHKMNEVTKNTQLAGDNTGHQLCVLCSLLLRSFCGH